MQMSYGQYRRLIEDLAYFKELVASGLMHANKTSFSTKRKVVRDN